MYGDSRQEIGGWNVPPGLLERPYRDELRHVDRSDATLEVDRHLRRLGRQETLARRALGRLGAALLARRGHHALSFACLGDYTRERLGISARELQTAARVVSALEQLPRTAAAFAAGRINWTQACLLVRVATAENEDQWLAVAHARSVRALDAVIHSGWRPSARGAPNADPGVPGGIDADVATDAANAGEAAGSGDAAGVAGDAGGAGDAADAAAAILASASMAADDEDALDGEASVRLTIRCPRRVKRQWRAALELARRVSGADVAVWQAAEAIAAEGLSAAAAASVASSSLSVPAAADDLGCDARAAPGEALPEHGLGDPDEHDAGIPDLDRSILDDAAPAAVENLALGCDSLDAFELDARLRAVLDAMRRIDWQTGRLLRLFFDLRLYVLAGFSSRSRYVRERLGMSVRKAESLVAIERRTWDAPAFMDAYQRGDLSWLQALTLLPLVHDATADAWIARARGATLRRLVAEVDWALDAREANPLAPAWPLPLGTPLPPFDAQMRAPSGLEEASAQISFRAPVSVVGLVRAAIAAFAGPFEAPWRGLERLLDHVTAEWSRGARHRDPVFERDGWRCAVPGCGARRHLHDHHLVYRSRGGSNAQSNRVAICAWHHLHGIHAGRVRAWGEAPHAVRWQLGVGRGRAPLMDLKGDFYVTGS